MAVGTRVVSAVGTATSLFFQFIAWDYNDLANRRAFEVEIKSRPVFEKVYCVHSKWNLTIP